MADNTAYVAPDPLPGDSLEGGLPVESIASGEGPGRFISPDPLEAPEAGERLKALAQGAVGGGQVEHVVGCHDGRRAVVWGGCRAQPKCHRSGI